MQFRELSSGALLKAAGPIIGKSIETIVIPLP